MKSIKCPHCGHKIIAARMTHEQSPAIKKVLKAARIPQPITKLAIIYQDIAFDMHARKHGYFTLRSWYSSRRAIERLAKDGYLIRVRPGIYRTK